MKPTAPPLLIFISASSLLILFLFIPTGLLLFTLEMNSYPVNSAFGQEVVETTTEPNTLTPDLSPAQERQKEQQQQDPNSGSILLTDIERLEFVERAGDAAEGSTYLRMSTTGETRSVVK
jgi:hypothetical protein